MANHSSKGSASDWEGSEDEEAARELNISGFVKAELHYYDCSSGDSDSADDRQDQDWVSLRALGFRQSHIKTKHLSSSDSSALHKCSQCEKMFKKKSNLKVHILNSHTEYDPAACVCGHCGKRFKNPLSLKRHLQTFHDEAKKKAVSVCPECGKQFKKATNLRIHLECVHTTYQPGQWVCSLCLKELKNQHSLKSHMREVHAEKVEEKDIKETFQCEECQKIFKKKKDLRGHKTAAHKVDLRKCEVCSGEYKNQTALKQHLRLVHGPTETVSCQLCFKSFKNLTRLKHHHLDVHKVDNSVCPDCGKTFKNRFLMKKHLRYLHRREKGKEDCSEEKTESKLGSEESSSQSSGVGGVKREETTRELGWSSTDYSHSQVIALLTLRIFINI